MFCKLVIEYICVALQDVDERPAAKAAAKLEAEMADRDLAKLIVLTPSRKNGLDGKSGSHSHSHHVGSALTEGLRLFDEVSRASGLHFLCQSETAWRQAYVEQCLTLRHSLFVRDCMPTSLCFDCLYSPKKEYKLGTGHAQMAYMLRVIVHFTFRLFNFFAMDQHHVCSVASRSPQQQRA